MRQTKLKILQSANYANCDQNEQTHQTPQAYQVTRHSRLTRLSFDLGHRLDQGHHLLLLLPSIDPPPWSLLQCFNLPGRTSGLPLLLLFTHLLLLSLPVHWCYPDCGRTRVWASSLKATHPPTRCVVNSCLTILSFIDLGRGVRNRNSQNTGIA